MLSLELLPREKLEALAELKRRGLDVTALVNSLTSSVEATGLYNTADPIQWIETNFYIPETTQAIKLAEYQKACLREVLTFDEAGHFPYSTIVWSDIKKSAKSTIAAAVGLWMAFRKPWASIKVVANDLKQADSRVAYFMRRAIELNPKLSQVCRMKPSGYLIELPNSSRIEAVPIDPTGEAGGNDDMVIFSELWGAHHKAQERMWTEMTLSPTKFGQSFRWIETYAGFEGESVLLRQLYDQGVIEEQRVSWAGDEAVLPTTNDGPVPLEAFANKQSRLFCLWNGTPRMPWQIPEYYAQEAGQLTPNEFDRVHRNKWASSTNRFIDPVWWGNCLDRDLPPMQPREPLCLAADAGVTNDYFALVGVTRHPVRKKDIAVRFSKVWIPNGRPLDFEQIEQEIVELKKLYPNIVDLAYDEFQLHHMMTRLGNRGWPTEKFSQRADREIADKQLLDMLLHSQIAHDGTHAELGQHLANANAKVSGEQDRLRIVKRSDKQKIDLAVCLSMAAYRCSKFNLG